MVVVLLKPVRKSRWQEALQDLNPLKSHSGTAAALMTYSEGENQGGKRRKQARAEVLQLLGRGSC